VSTQYFLKNAVTFYVVYREKNFNLNTCTYSYQNIIWLRKVDIDEYIAKIIKRTKA